METKKHLLELGETLTRDIVNTVFVMLEEGIKESENKLDDSLLPLLPSAKEFILKYVDKIDE